MLPYKGPKSIKHRIRMQLSHIAQVHIAYFTHAAGMILCAIVFRQTERKPCTSYQTYFSFPSPHPFPVHAHHEEKYGLLARLLACADIGAPRVSTSLTLGAHAQRGLQLSFRVYVYMSVCLSVCQRLFSHYRLRGGL